jgi:hypothetical protein
MSEFNDSANSDFSTAYIDSSAGVIMMISAQKSKFKDVKEYIDCSHLELEQQLQSEYGDTTLRLISCNRPDFYPKKTTVIRFEVGGLSPGYSTYMIYFIHHRHYDIQISFMYKRANEVNSMKYIKDMMGTLALN